MLEKSAGLPILAAGMDKIVVKRLLSSLSGLLPPVDNITGRDVAELEVKCE
jgi:hypothetical protein